VLIVEIADTAGPIVFIYNASGSIFIALCYHLYHAWLNLYQKGTFWSDLNFVTEGKLRLNHVMGFGAYICLLFTAQNMVYLTIYCAQQANINPGVITTIWSIDPMFLAIVDYLVFGQRL
jgi:hypothetical protein